MSTQSTAGQGKHSPQAMADGGVLPGGPEESLGNLTYEQARDALGAVLRQLEGGASTLEQSLTLWERGEALAAICQARLDGVRARIDARRPGGDVSRSGEGAAPF